jgi:hypothetical protein
MEHIDEETYRAGLIKDIEKLLKELTEDVN